MAKPKKPQKPSYIVPDVDEEIMVNGSLQDAINAVRKKPADERVPPLPVAPSSLSAAPVNPDIRPVPEGETPLTPAGKAFFDAVFSGQPPPEEGPPVVTAFTGYGNLPDLGIPAAGPTQYDFRPPAPEPKAPSRPRTPQQPKPQVYKTTADDAELMEIVTLRTKIEAYMRIKPELARQVAMPVRGSSAEDHRMALAQCRTMLSCGNEEVWLEWGLVYGAQMIEGLLPFIRERVPDAVAIQLNAGGFSGDVRDALSGKDDTAHGQNLRVAMQLCAVDLIGLISVSPWAMLAMGMLQMFTQKVHKNNEMMRARYMSEAGREGVQLQGEYDDL